MTTQKFIQDLRAAIDAQIDFRIAQQAEDSEGYRVCAHRERDEADAAWLEVLKHVKS